MTTPLAIVRRYSQRAQVWTFLGCFFLVGLGVGFSLSTIVSRGLIEDRFAAYDRQVSRLNQEIDDQIALNRIDIASVAYQASRTAQMAAENTEQLNEITKTLMVIAKKLDRTATTVRSAAVTAKSAAVTAVEATVEAKKANEPNPPAPPPLPARRNNPIGGFPEHIEP